MNVTHFGEIVELDSRAVWYSDEEDDDDSIEDDLSQSRRKSANLDSVSQETMRSNVNIRFRFSQHKFPLNVKFSSCIISQASAAQFKNFKLDPNNLLGFIDNIGKAIVCPIATNQTANDGNILWLLFDSTAQYLSKQEVCYFVEKLRGLLYSDFSLDPSCPIILLSQQFSSGEHLEFLINYPTNDALLKLPFQGCPIKPPSLIRNQFESALFEQLTLTLKPALLVCLPDPKNSWFDKTTFWPTVPDKIIELRLSDDHLEKTLIFT